MRMRVLVILVALSGLGWAQGSGAVGGVGVGGDLRRVVEGILAEPEVVRAHWGIAVVGMDGAPIYMRNEGQYFEPASNAKLFTTAAAMALLGGERRFTTVVEARGTMVGAGRLQGDLVLVGSGDANLSGRTVPYVEPKDRPQVVAGAPVAAGRGLRYLEEMADRVVATGLKRVEGDVVGDDRVFPWEPYGEDWAIDDALWGYGAPVSGLTVNDNQVKVTVAPGAVAGAAGTVVVDPAMDYYGVDGAGLVTGAVGSGNHVRMDRALGSKVLRVDGVIGVDAGAEVEEVAIQDPAEYAAMALKAMLEARGVEVTGRARAEHRELTGGMGFWEESRMPLPKLAETAMAARSKALTAGSGCLTGCGLRVEHVSPTVAEDVVVTNKVSQNLHAELLLRQLGKAYGSDGSAAQGARVVRQFLLDAGVDGEDFVFVDGSGLSGHDLVTPRAVVRLLQYASGQSWFGAWKASLPVGGVDGGLEGRFAKGPLMGKVFAKTGTLGEARALSGYLECGSGRMVMFSIMVNNHAPHTRADREVIDRIVGAIAAAE